MRTQVRIPMHPLYSS